MTMHEGDLLEEQRAFYRARAPEYDEWWQRRGRFDRGPASNEEWHRQIGRVEEALIAFGARGRVLELAGGTGWWTERLARSADHLTVVDASPETLALNRQRVARPDIGYIVDDVFSWQPTSTYDVVFFSFWLSHVPRERFDQFWATVRVCLAPGGRVFFIDSHDDSNETVLVNDPNVIQYGPDLHLRRLRDGSQYRVVKVMYETDELQALLDDRGWTAQVDATPWFLFGSGSPKYVRVEPTL
jgi:demethylmenaquinone methyltransferase/2-methoxy-6-polyprenyl-1,4-benzoquinol methylase